MYPRAALLLPLDDLLAVTREFLNDKVSRSGLDRCLRRHGVASLKALLPPPEKAPVKSFKPYEPGFIHVDVKYLPAIEANRTALTAKTFLKAAIQAAPFRVQKCLTDNGSEFTDRFLNRHKRPSGDHEFDQICADQGVEHRLSPPRHPQTNGMVERFNGRIADVPRTHRFDSTEDLETTLHRYVTLYNQHIPQRALGHIPPVQALKNWQASHPQLFQKKVYKQTGLDS